MQVLDFNHDECDENGSNYAVSKPDNPIYNKGQIKFINYTQQYCIGIIDIVNSTNETSKISSPNKLRKYYSLFLNTMSSVINSCNGKVIKTIGDSLFFYFPKTCNETNGSAFHDVFEAIQARGRTRYKTVPSPAGGPSSATAGLRSSGRHLPGALQKSKIPARPPLDFPAIPF